MVLYEQRLAADLDLLRDAVEDVTANVVSALQRSVEGIRRDDRDLLYEVVLDDHQVNRKIRRIDKSCHSFVARHLPAAGHLRFVSSVMRLAVALERAGDYAVTISRVFLQLERKLSESVLDDVTQLAELSGSMLHDSIQAFLAGDADLARDTRVRGITIDRLYDAAFHRLIEEGHPSFRLASLLTIFGKIERVSDQAKNICEETVFAATGELKQPKVFRVLFVDDRNDLLSPLAAALCRKTYAEGGVYSSAGWNPAPRVDPRLLAMADQFGLDASRARPTKMRAELPDYPIDYHVIVALNAGDGAALPKIPYHTVLRHWDVPLPPSDADDSAFDPVVRELGAKVQTLMERLRGPDA